jgi:phosphoribosylformylglycinamidine synthase subunit PurS
LALGSPTPPYAPTIYALQALGGYVSRVIVDVMLKPEIHDPQGEAVLSASRRLGFGGVTRVRQGKRFEVEIDGPADTAALAAIEELAHELLANPVIEEFSLHAAELPVRPGPSSPWHLGCMAHAAAYSRLCGPYG